MKRCIVSFGANVMKLSLLRRSVIWFQVKQNGHMPACQMLAHYETGKPRAQRPRNYWSWRDNVEFRWSGREHISSYLNCSQMRFRTWEFWMNLADKVFRAGDGLMKCKHTIGEQVPLLHYSNTLNQKSNRLEMLRYLSVLRKTLWI